MPWIFTRRLKSGDCHYVGYRLPGQTKAHVERVGQDRRTAELRLREVEAMLAERGGDTGQSPLGELVEAFLAAKVGGWGPDHRRHGVAWLGRLAKWLGEEYGITDTRHVGATHIDAWKAARLDEVRAVTLANELRVFKTFFTWAQRRGRIVLNPFDLVDPLPVVRSRLRVLSVSEIRRLLDAAAGGYLWRVAIVGIYTGLRKSEMVHAELRDVSEDAHWLTVQPKPWLGWAPKNRRPRRIPLADRVAAWARGERAERGEGWLILNGAGNRLNPSRVDRDFRAMVRGFGWRHVSLHTMRHTFASHLLDQGANLLDVSRWLGHARASTTTDIYGHYIRGHREDVNLLPGATEPLEPREGAREA